MSKITIDDILAHDQVLASATKRYRLASEGPDDEEYRIARAEMIAANDKARELKRLYCAQRGY